MIDEMPESIHERLVGAAFLGYEHRYYMLLGWIDSIPPEYDNVEIDDDVHCESLLVFELPRALREMLPERVRHLL